MKTSINGKFNLKATPDTSDEVVQAIGAMRMRFDKVFEGPLDAQSTVSMIGIMNKELGSGAYVAIERIVGSIEGKKGSFCMQHSCTMERNKQEQHITVIPDTGTDQLKGLRGEMTIEIAQGGQHFYVFEFELP